MLVAFNDWAFGHLPEASEYVAQGVEGLAQAAHDLGFKAFQLSTRRPKDPDWFRTIDAARLRERLEQVDVRMSLHDHAIDLLSLHHFAERDDYYDTFRAYLRAAGKFMRDVGGDLVTFHPPQVNVHYWTENAFGDPAVRARATDAFWDVVVEAGDLADELGVAMAFEAICFGPPFIGGTVFRGMADLDDFLNRPGFPASVGLLVDTTHFHHKGIDVPGVLVHWRDKLFDMHVSDSIGHRWIDADNYQKRMLDEVHMPVGQGTTDFQAIVNTLTDLGYDGRLTTELYPQHVHSLADIVNTREALEECCRQAQGVT